jgi:purine-nucleoside phosphorylase
VRTAAAVAARCGVTRPAAALILGSGLGGFARHIEGATRIPFGEIPGLPRTAVQGHAGELVHGIVHGQEVIALSGRLHLYEGHSASVVALPVRILHALGAGVLFVSNAAGAIRPGVAPGTLMVIRDHINLSFRNPLIGPPVVGDTRFPDMSSPYDSALGASFGAAARAAGADVIEGVYAGVLGPSFETPAEVRMLSAMGADAVGMSTIPEVLVARALGMRVLGVSCLTNAAAGTTPQRLTHAEVLATTNRVGPVFERAVWGWVGDRQFSPRSSSHRPPPGTQSRWVAEGAADVGDGGADGGGEGVAEGEVGGDRGR